MECGAEVAGVALINLEVGHRISTGDPDAKTVGIDLLY